ncbi:MAG: hypothetical protein ACXVDW_16920 [Bacteroidia bacterium]
MNAVQVNGCNWIAFPSINFGWKDLTRFNTVYFAAKENIPVNYIASTTTWYWGSKIIK